MDDQELSHTSRGRFILELFDHLEIKSSTDLRAPIAAEILAKLESCLPLHAGDPLIANGADKMWSMFHQLRLSEKNV